MKYFALNSLFKCHPSNTLERFKWNVLIPCQKILWILTRPSLNLCMVVCIAYDIQYDIWKLVDANCNDLTYFQTQLALISSAELEKLLQLQLFCKPCFNFSFHWEFSKVYFQTFELCRYKSHCWKQNSRKGGFLNWVNVEKF